MVHHFDNFPTSGHKVQPETQWAPQLLAQWARSQKIFRQGFTLRGAYLRIDERSFHPKRPKNIFRTGLTLAPLKFGIGESTLKKMCKGCLVLTLLDAYQLKRELPTHWVGTSGPVGQKLTGLRAQWTQSKNMRPVGTNFPSRVEFSPSKFGIFERKIFSQENPKKQASSMPTT